MEGRASTGAGVCTSTLAGRTEAVAVIFCRVFSSVPMANPENVITPLPFAVNVQRKVEAAPAVSVAFTGTGALKGPIWASPDDCCQEICGVVLFPFAVPVFVTVMYTVYTSPSFETDGELHMDTAGEKAVSDTIVSDDATFDDRPAARFSSVAFTFEVNTTVPPAYPE